MKNGKDAKNWIEEQIGEFRPDHVSQLIKMLHCEPDIEPFYQNNRPFREQMAFGVTKADAAECLGVDERTIFNMIAQLDPERRPEGTEPYYIAGQPINLKIKEKRINNTRLKDIDETAEVDRRVRFCSEGSMHPVFLQLNVTQLGALLRALAVDYKEYESNVTLGLGAYLYAQLSEYAKSRLVKVFAAQDKDIEEFLEQLDEMDETDLNDAFKTESELALLEGGKVSMDTLIMYVKNGWKCDVSIMVRDREHTYHGARIEYENGFLLCPAEGGNLIEIVAEMVVRIKRADE